MTVTTGENTAMEENDISHEKTGHAHHHIPVLGHVQLFHHQTKKVILVPTPSEDPNDPLNWSPAFKYFVAFTVSFAMLCANMAISGPSVAMVDMAVYFGVKVDGPAFQILHWITKCSYFFTAASCLQGTSNLFWVPLMTKYGRRPVYLFVMTGHLLTVMWCALAKSYKVELAGRLFMGCFTGAWETLGPLTIADIFFLHQRGFYMALYSSFISFGVGFGMFIGGFIIRAHTWQDIYWVNMGILGALAILIFAMPETAYIRYPYLLQRQITMPEKPNEHNLEQAPSEIVIPKKESFLHSLLPWNGIVLTEEPLWKITLRPLALILLPPVLWSGVLMACGIGFMVVITINVPTAFSQFYGFEPYQVGLCMLSACLGSLIGQFCGGPLSEYLTNVLTRRHGGIREPEFRLPGALIGGLMSPVALMLYGAGIEHHSHWIMPTIGLAFINISATMIMNSCLLYTIDAYRSIIGEVTVTELSFKSLFGFMLSFYTNQWIAKQGYIRTFGEMSAISGGVSLLAIPLFFYGKGIRHATYNWRGLSKLVQWDTDRDAGE